MLVSPLYSIEIFRFRSWIIVTRTFLNSDRTSSPKLLQQTKSNHLSMLHFQSLSFDMSLTQDQNRYYKMLVCHHREDCESSAWEQSQLAYRSRKPLILDWSTARPLLLVSQLFKKILCIFPQITFQYAILVSIQPLQCFYASKSFERSTS